MPDRRASGQPAAAGATFLVGITVGTVLVLAMAATFSAPFRLAVSPARGGELAELGCTLNHCINVTVRFSGASSLAPGSVEFTILPYNASEIVNGSSGAPLHLAYFASDQPRWTGDLGDGRFGGEFAGDVVDPSSQLVGSGGAGSITSGAVLCLRGNSTGPILEYYLSVAYGSRSVTVPFAIA